ncbi:MAG: CoA transferase, partial [candidate division NC10 bacterium]
RCDDSVAVVYAGKKAISRRSRGYAPKPILLRDHYPPVLALGPQLKATICILKDRYAFLSPHIGDMETPQARDFFHETISIMERITKSQPKSIACDLHPAYYSSLFARGMKDAEVIQVQHHHAHIVSCMADNSLTSDVIGVALDGPGFGTDGPYAGLPAVDEIIQTMSGLTSLTGEAAGPPLLTGTYVADFLTGVYAALGAVLALQSRAQSGRGQWVRMNLLQCLVSILNTTVSRYLTLGQAPGRHGNRNPLIAPGNLYHAQDGYVTVECLTQDMWEDLARAMAREDLLRDPRFDDVISRQRHAEALDREIEGWMRDKSVEQVLAILHERGVPSGPVLDIPALVTHPQFAVNQMVTSVDIPGLGPVPFLAPPIHMDGDTTARRGRPPRHGEHTGEVLEEWLGLTPSEVAELRAAAAL